MNIVFFALIATAFVVAAIRETTGGGAPMQMLAEATLDAAKDAVPLALGLVGVMALFMGLMKVAEAGGLLKIMARLLRPVMHRLFPEVPPDHPAMGAMVLNLSANMLGLGNAATPFGLRAMQYLQSLNRHKDTASDSMVLFLAINTASVTLLPTSVIALRASLGAADPAAVIVPTLMATAGSAVVAVLAARGLAPWFPMPEEHASPNPATADPASDDTAPRDAADDVTVAPEAGYPAWVGGIVLAGGVGLALALLGQGRALSAWLVPGLVVGLLGFGVARGVKVYEHFVLGAREAFTIAVHIIPYLVAILVAVGMFRASGAMEMVLEPIGRLTHGLPQEALVLAVMRSLSGSGAYALLASFLKDPAIGPDGFTGVLLGTIHASTETTFYVIAVYFGAVRLRRIRHALAVGLIADGASLLFAWLACTVLFS